MKYALTFATHCPDNWPASLQVYDFVEEKLMMEVWGELAWGDHRGYGEWTVQIAVGAELPPGSYFAHWRISNKNGTGYGVEKREPFTIPGGNSVKVFMDDDDRAAVAEVVDDPSPGNLRPKDHQDLFVYRDYWRARERTDIAKQLENRAAEIIKLRDEARSHEWAKCRDATALELKDLASVLRKAAFSTPLVVGR